MKRNGVWAILAGVLVVMLVLLVFVRIYFPNDLAPASIAIYAGMIALWLNAYRVSRKKQAV